MNVTGGVRSSARWAAAGAGLVAGAYAAYVGLAWCSYGRVQGVPKREDVDPVLDRFMPVYEVRTRHQIRVAAPAEITLASAREMNLFESSAVGLIFRAREIILGATPDERPRPQGLLADMQSLGWGVLAEIADREIVVGAVTQPWKANVVFRAVPPDEFRAFEEPGCMKIAWTLCADPIGESESVFSTETRVVSTDAVARARFRAYWSSFSPGMILIRWLLLGPLQAEAERRARANNIPPHF